MNDVEVQQRVASRRWAEDACEAADDKAAFVQRVMQLGGMEPKVPEVQTPMTDQEALAFEQTVIFFGVHKGETVGDVSLGYLCRLTDPSSPVDEFMSQARRYLRSPMVRRLLESEP